MRIAILIVLVMAACSKKTDSSAAPKAEAETKATPALPAPPTGSAPPGDAIGEAIAKMKGYADAACACKDKPCADKVLADYNAYVPELKRSTESLTPNEQQTKEMGELGERFGTCMTKLSTAR